MKRFYKQASVLGEARAWKVTLDGRLVKTPGKASLILPTKALAEALAAEWANQGERVEPDTMPLTQYTCSAIDRVGPARASVIHMVSAYIDTDLLSYPTQTPPELRARQDGVWLPLLARAATLGWPLKQTNGLMAIAQDADLRPRARAWLEGKADMPLTALASLIEASGSFILAYLFGEGEITIDDLINACTLEEQFNMERWGKDEEAEALLARREADLRSAAQMFDLLQ